MSMGSASRHGSDQRQYDNPESSDARNGQGSEAHGIVWRSAYETDLAECATWISFGSRSLSTLTIQKSNVSFPRCSARRRRVGHPSPIRDAEGWVYETVLGTGG